MRPRIALGPLRQINDIGDVDPRLEAGYDQGRPPFGMRFDVDSWYWISDEEFPTALKVIDLRDAGGSYRTIKEKIGVPYSTTRRIVERRDRDLSADQG